jgi:hypothetical protein
MANRHSSRCDCRRCIATEEAAQSLRQTACRCGVPANPSGGIFRCRPGSTAPAAHGCRPARKRPLVKRSPLAASLRIRSIPGSRSPRPSGRQLSIRSVLRQRPSSPVVINRNNHRIPVPPVGYRPDRSCLPCRHTPILWTVPYGSPRDRRRAAYRRHLPSRRRHQLADAITLAMLEGCRRNLHRHSTQQASVGTPAWCQAAPTGRTQPQPWGFGTHTPTLMSWQSMSGPLIEAKNHPGTTLPSTTAVLPAPPTSVASILKVWSGVIVPFK